MGNIITITSTERAPGPSVNTAATGVIEFELTSAVRDTVGNTVIEPVVVQAPIINGVMTPVKLFATDIAGFVPSTARYKVIKRIDGISPDRGGRVISYIEVPSSSAGDTLDLADAPNVGPPTELGEGGGGGGGVGGAVGIDSLWDAEGDLAVGTGANTAGRLPVGSTGQVLLADHAQSLRVRWGPIPPTPASPSPGAVNIKDAPYSAIGDGQSHPLSQRFATLGAAQAVFPHATGLSDEIDWAAWQGAATSGHARMYVPEGDYVTNKPVVPSGDLYTISGDAQDASRLLAKPGSGLARVLDMRGRIGRTLRDLGVRGSNTAAICIDFDHATIGTSTQNRLERVRCGDSTAVSVTMGNNGDSVLDQCILDAPASGISLRWEDPGGNIGIHNTAIAGRTEASYQQCHVTGGAGFLSGFKSLPSGANLTLAIDGSYLYPDGVTGRVVDATDAPVLSVALRSCEATLGAGQCIFDGDYSGVVLVENISVEEGGGHTAASGIGRMFGTNFDGIDNYTKVIFLGGYAAQTGFYNEPSSDLNIEVSLVGFNTGAGGLLSRWKVGTTAPTPLLVGAVGQPAFANSWVNFGGANQVLSYYRDYSGVVHVYGSIKDGTLGTTVFTLPLGYRPVTALFRPAASGASGATFASCSVAPDGSVAVYGSSNALVAFELSFRTDA
jgi:hypothetical protein